MTKQSMPLMKECNGIAKSHTIQSNSIAKYLIIEINSSGNRTQLSIIAMFSLSTHWMSERERCEARIRHTIGFANMRRVFLWRCIFTSIVICRPADDFSLFKLWWKKTLEAFEYIVIYHKVGKKRETCAFFSISMRILNTSLAFSVCFQWISHGLTMR